MVKLAGILNKWEPFKILVAGDLLLDAYTIGKAKRISPEAPVAIVNVQKEEYKAGGAGNVMLNLVSLGANVVTLGRIGNDVYGQVLKNLLDKEGIDTRGLIVDNSYLTPVKNRIIAENQQIVRIDHETISTLSEEAEKIIINKIPELLKDVKVVAISDYGKGFLTNTVLQALFFEAKKLNIVVVTDPKGSDFVKYKGTSIIKPNLSEAYAAAKLQDFASLELVASKILSETESDTLIITRSESGISTFSKEGSRQDFPVRVKDVKDVTGAGDTVLATLASAIANDCPLAEAIQLCNVAAGIAIEQIGCARVTVAEVAKRLLENDIDNKVFDGQHLFALQHALMDQPFNLLRISSKNGFNYEVFAKIKAISAIPQEKLLVYIEEENPPLEFLDILVSLKEVNFIMLCSNSLDALCRKVTPQKTILM